MLTPAAGARRKERPLTALVRRFAPNEQAYLLAMFG